MSTPNNTPSSDVKNISSDDWAKMQKLVLQRMHAKYDGMTKRMQDLPTLHFQDPVTMDSVLLSPANSIKEVEGLTEVGKQIILGVINHIANMQP